MSEEPTQEVLWVPALAVATIMLLVTYFVPVGGAIIGVLGLIGLVVRVPRQGWTLLTWACLGAVVGAGIVWALIGLHAAF